MQQWPEKMELEATESVEKVEAVAGGSSYSARETTEDSEEDKAPHCTVGEEADRVYVEH